MSKEANLIPMNPVPAQKEFQFPTEIEEAKGKELKGDVDWEWIPDQPGDFIVGNVVQVNSMHTYGGLAVVFGLQTGEKALLKKGGRVFEQMFTDLALKKGDYVAVMYMGESAAKDGQNPARLWRIKKIDK